MEFESVFRIGWRFIDWEMGSVVAFDWKVVSVFFNALKCDLSQLFQYGFEVWVAGEVSAFAAVEVAEHFAVVGGKDDEGIVDFWS